jgi:hypothetical protein
MFGLTTVAMNKFQYAGSVSCGQCIRVYRTGVRCPGGKDPDDGSCGLGANPISGTFDAIVTDELMERGLGDIDLGRQGDGFWPVSWQKIACPIEMDPTGILLRSCSCTWTLHGHQLNSMKCLRTRGGTTIMQSSLNPVTVFLSTTVCGISPPLQLWAQNIVGQLILHFALAPSNIRPLNADPTSIRWFK